MGHSAVEQNVFMQVFCIFFFFSETTAMSFVIFVILLLVLVPYGKAFFTFPTAVLNPSAVLNNLSLSLAIVIYVWSIWFWLVSNIFCYYGLYLWVLTMELLSQCAQEHIIFLSGFTPIIFSAPLCTLQGSKVLVSLNVVTLN